MGTYIKGTEMPENCFDCICCHLLDPLAPLYRCKAARINFGPEDMGWFRERRPNWCPLVAVPEKHGRLIDADDFFQRLGEKDRTFSFHYDGMFVGISDMNEILSSLKTVIEAEGGD